MPAKIVEQESFFSSAPRNFIIFVLALLAAKANFPFRILAVSYWGGMLVNTLIGTTIAGAWKSIKIYFSHTVAENIILDKASKNEKTAAKAGVLAKTWPGYFTSFKIKQAWLQPVAFETGLQAAINKNEHVLEKLR